MGKPKIDKDHEDIDGRKVGDDMSFKAQSAGRRQNGKPSDSVFGVTTTAPRLTGWGIWCGVRYIALPFLGLLAALDILGYLVARFIFGTCYGVLCLL